MVVEKEITTPRILLAEDHAYFDEQTFARRAWWLELHTGADLRTGTTFDQIEAAVERAEEVAVSQ